MNTTTKALAALKHIETQFEKLGSNLTFTEQIDSIWSLCALQLYDTKALESLIKNLNGLNFERLDNELRYEEYMKMLDIHNALKIEAPKHLQITN